MNKNILRFSLFGIAGRQEVDHTFVKLEKRATMFNVARIELIDLAYIFCCFYDF